MHILQKSPSNKRPQIAVTSPRGNVLKANDVQRITYFDVFPFQYDDMGIIGYRTDYLEGYSWVRVWGD